MRSHGQISLITKQKYHYSEKFGNGMGEAALSLLPLDLFYQLLLTLFHHFFLFTSPFVPTFEKCSKIIPQSNFTLLERAQSFKTLLDSEIDVVQNFSMPCFYLILSLYHRLLYYFKKKLPKPMLNNKFSYN